MSGKLSKEALESLVKYCCEVLVKKGFATKVIVNGVPEYGLTEKGLQEAKRLKKDEQK